MVGVNLLSTLVALGMLGLIATIAVAAITRYTAEEALKIMGVLSGLFGVVTGTFVTYFFTREPLAVATRQAEEAEVRAKTAEMKLAGLQANATDLVAALNKYSDQTSVAALRQDSKFGNYLTYATNPEYYESDPTARRVLERMWSAQEKVPEQLPDEKRETGK